MAVSGTEVTGLAIIPNPAVTAPLPVTALAAIESAAMTLEDADVVCGHGYANTDDEAAVLVAYVLGVSPSQIDDYLDRELTAQQRHALAVALERRCAAREPLAYITGEIDFAGLRFLCDKRALVPRSLIAQLLHEGFLPWLDPSTPVTRVLDLCTGGGNLAVIAAKQFESATIIASDISAEALALAKLNRQLHGLDDTRLQLIQSDVFSAGYFQQVPPPQFDLILCNPPYVNQQSMTNLPAEFRQEPAMALGSGSDGMDLIRLIVAQSATYLAQTGLLVLEIGNEAAHFEAAFAHLEYTYLPVDAGDDMVVLIENAALKRFSKR